MHLYGAEVEPNQYLYVDGIGQCHHVSGERDRYLGSWNFASRHRYGDPGWPTICTCCTKCVGTKWSSAIGMVTSNSQWLSNYFLCRHRESWGTNLYVNNQSGHARD